MEIILTHLQINYPIWFQIFRYSIPVVRICCLVCVSLGISGDLRYHPASVGSLCSEWTKRQEQSCSKKATLGVLTWMHLASQMFTESILKVLFSFVRPDLRLLLCDDFKDYPRRGKFTEATRLKNSSMSKAFLHLIWPSYHFQNLVEQIWLRKVYTYIMHGNFMCCLDVAESIFRISYRWTFQPFNTATKPHMGVMKIVPPIARCVWQKQKFI